MTFKFSDSIRESKAAIDTMREQLRMKAKDEVTAALEDVKMRLKFIQHEIKDSGLCASELDEGLDALIAALGDLIAEGLK